MTSLTRVRALKATSVSFSLLACTLLSCSAVDENLYAGSWLFDFNPDGEEVNNQTCVVDSNGDFDCLLTWGAGDPARAVGNIAVAIVDGTLRLEQGGAEVKTYALDGDCPTFNGCSGKLLEADVDSGSFTMTRE
jgi:hypothetical protein